MSPLDPRISLGGQAPQIQNPLEAMTQIAQLQEMREQSDARRLAGEEARQKAKDAAAIRQVLTETNGDLDAALPRLRTINPAAALKFETEIQAARKEKFAAAENQMQARTKELDYVGAVSSLVHDDASARVVGERLRAFSSDVTALLPDPNEPYDPARWQRVTDLALTAKERYEKSQANLKLFGEGKLQEALGGALSTSANADEWNGHINGFLDLGGAKPIAEMFGSYSPENVARAAQLAITPTQRATLAGQEAGRAQTAAHQGVLEAQGAERVAMARQRAAQGGDAPLVQVMENGVPVWRTRSQAVGQQAGGGAAGAGRPATEGERKAAGFHAQMQQALTTINELESKLTERDLYQIQSLPQEGFTGAINRSQMSEAAKRYIQAFNQFTEARLRPVSGAAIADTEYARDRATYGKQYAETKELATQREAARKTALGSLRTMAGSALEDTPPPPSSDPLSVTAPDGNTYHFPSAAEAAAFKRRAGIP